MILSPTSLLDYNLSTLELPLSSSPKLPAMSNCPFMGPIGQIFSFHIINSLNGICHYHAFSSLPQLLPIFLIFLPTLWLLFSISILHPPLQCWYSLKFHIFNFIYHHSLNYHLFSENTYMDISNLVLSPELHTHAPLR